MTYAKITHPTWPESSGGGAAAVTTMLGNWNTALNALKPAIQHPDANRSLVLYGSAFQASELKAVPEFDLPAGTPAWMHSREDWARRTGSTPEEKRATITVKVPAAFLP